MLFAVMQKLPHCGFCGITATDQMLMKCSGCLTVYYCGREHQRFDWKKHKPLCKMQQQHFNKPPHVLSSSSVSTSASDSQLGTSLNSDQSDCVAPPDDIRHPPDNFTLAVPLPIFPGDRHRPSVIQSTGRPKQECLSLTTIPERRKTYGTDDFLNAANFWEKQRDRKMSMDPQNPPSRNFRLARLDSDDETRDAAGLSANNSQVTPDFFNMIGVTDKLDHTQNRPFDLSVEARFKIPESAPNKHAAFVLRIRRIANVVAQSMKQYGWCVLDNFLGHTHAAAIFGEVCGLYVTPGKFADGQLVKSREGGSSQDIRSDKIYWFDNRVDEGVNIGFLVSMIDSVIYHLSHQVSPYKVNGRSRAMIACYPSNGSKYVKHVDNPDKDGRCITALYYLNKSWEKENGGVLRLFPETSMCPIDIEPLLDRLLFFWSDRRNPHEVLPAFTMRYAITIWYFDAEERNQALIREEQERQKNNLAGLPTEVVGSTTNGGIILENHIAKVALNSPPHFSSTDSLLGTAMSSSGSLPSLQDASIRGSRTNSLNWTADAGVMLDATNASLAVLDNEYSVRRATFDLGHLSRNRHSPDVASTKSMATVPETKSPDNEQA